MFFYSLLTLKMCFLPSVEAVEFEPPGSDSEQEGEEEDEEGKR